MDDAQIAEGLGLHEIKNRRWAIFKCSATKGERAVGGDGVARERVEEQAEGRRVVVVRGLELVGVVLVEIASASYGGGRSLV